MAEQTDKQTDAGRHEGSIDGLAIKRARGGKKANLPEILDQDIEGKDEIALLLERTLDAKIEVEQNTKFLNDCKEQLGEHTACNGLEGLRHGKVVFTQRLQDGRKILDTEKLCQELLTRGVKAEVIEESIKAATKQGESYWVREITSL